MAIRAPDGANKLAGIEPRFVIVAIDSFCAGIVVRVKV